MTAVITRAASAAALCALLIVSTAEGQITTMNTRLVQHISIPSFSGVLENWGYHTATNRYLLQCLGNSGMVILDTTNPETAGVIKSLPGIAVADVKVHGSYAYATWDNSPTYVIDLSNPATATVVGTIANGGHTIEIDGDRMYLNQRVQGQMLIYDLSVNAISPPLIGQYPPVALPGSIHDCEPRGNIVYQFCGAGTRILDVTNPANITVLGTVPAGTTSGDIYITTSGNKVLITCDDLVGYDFVRFWNIDSASSPVQLSSYQSNPGMGVHTLHVRGQYAYLSCLRDGLRILDISNPALPFEAGVFDQNPGNIGPTVSNSRACYPFEDCVYLTELNNLLGPNMMGLWLVEFFPSTGIGSAGTGGVVPTQWWGFGPPTPGNNDFMLKLRDAAPNATAILILGFSNTSWGGIPLPYDLGQTGIPGGNLYVSIDATATTTTSSTGRCGIPIPVPAQVGPVTLWSQWAVIDPGAPNQLGLSLTNYGRLAVQ